MKAPNSQPNDGYFEQSSEAAALSLNPVAAQSYRPSDLNAFGQPRDLKALASELPSLGFLSAADAAKEINHLREDPRFAMLSPEQIRQMMASEAMANRDKFSFVSAAICGPFFLFGIGAAFALLDDIKGAREAKLQNLLAGRGDGTKSGIVAAVRAETMQETAQKAEGEKRRTKPLTPEAARLLGLDPRLQGSTRLEAMRDDSVKAEIKRKMEARARKLENNSGSVREVDVRADVTERVKQRLVNESGRAWEAASARMSLKTWMKAQGLMKSKQSLLDQMEKVRGKANFNTYSGMAARLEVVDKELKRLGL